MKRALLVSIPTVHELAAVLTGSGYITGIDHEGTITYELEGESEFDLGRTSVEVEHELNSYTPGCSVRSGKA